LKKLTESEAARIRLNPPTNLNLEEASAYVGVSTKTIRDEVKHKRLRVARLGRRLIFQKIELDRYLSALSEASA
jgi:excisionase family DNA binding protein